LFRSLRINIFIYYFLTTSIFLSILYYFTIITHPQNTTYLFIIFFALLVFSGVIISKLSVEPLALHVENLQNLSKETLHELNLPITTIITNIHLLKKSLQNEKDLKRAARIEDACKMLQDRYNELDYMIKLQSSNVAKEIFSLDKLVENRVSFLKAIYPQIEFDLELESTQITNDKVGLSKIIDNLIDNGVKYSQNIHKITIKLRNNTLSIQDYGIGMDEVEIIQIFDNFYQSNKDMQGFGIGLSMVKRFCDKNHVSLNLKSKPNEGTIVSLKFKED
jgi:signal transduction histidine kinase